MISSGAVAQDFPALPPENNEASNPITVNDTAGVQTAGSPAGLEPESLPRELAEDIYQGANTPKLGPTAVSDVRFLMDRLGLENLLGESRIRSFGWVEGGYSGASSASGLLSVEPRQNRFGNEFLLNQIGLVLQKPLRQDQLDFGFNIRYFAGADAALGQPKGGIGFPVGNSHFGQDFRDLYVSAHLPILTEGGVDVKAGRMNSIIGYNGFLAPYRPFYSSDYQFFYSQDGAFTGVLTNLHVNKRLDMWNGMTFGANTFFTKRSTNSICYIGQINYWLTDEQKTRLTASVYCGPNAIFAAPGLAGTFDTTLEFRLQHNWSERFTQIIQSNMGWDANTPVGVGSWYGLYTIGLFHLTSKLDINARGEWFQDALGTRTGINTDYSEVTLGLNWHPVKCLEFRPEIRGDFAGQPAFGSAGNPTDRSQLTGGISVLLKF
ncbi:outer membrane beta-barrel protein [Tundrisphaera lichenicola]|uniref:outer membrane beta-barrel protein n=1 Tax=Tundrisphaera lichenicola TaxID=2029860 RepID=UPI003EB8C48A